MTMLPVAPSIDAPPSWYWRNKKDRPVAVFLCECVVMTYARRSLIRAALPVNPRK
jgi:hypothetical protein